MKKFFVFFLYFIFLFSVINYISATEKIDINTATIQQLDQIIGIGPELAQRIINARPFSLLDDLLKVKGIGEKTLKKIKEQGLACVNCTTVISDPIIVSTPTSTATPEPIVYPGGIILNELLPSPQGADEEGEYIEIYNSNNFEVDLSNWKIKDKEGTITVFTISNNTKILANNFLAFKRPETKISLNNSGDTVVLFSPDNKEKDSISFSDAKTGQSYNKTDSGNWTWSQTQTSGAKNIITYTAAASIVSKIKSENQKTSQNSGLDYNKESLAALNELLNPEAQNTSLSQNPWPLFLIVLAIAIILASVLLTIRLRLKK